MNLLKFLGIVQVYKAYEYRIYLSPKQETYVAKMLGLKRLYWNLNIANKQSNKNYKLLTYHRTFEQYAPEALIWLKEVDVVPLNAAYMDINQAYQNFYNSCKKIRKGKFVQPPKFKSRKNKLEAIRYNNCKFRDGKLFITRKLGLINGNFSSQFCEGKIRNTTLRRTATGKWFVKICVDKKQEPKCDNGKIIGIDWNCKDDSFISMSDGTKAKCPRFLKRKQNRLAKYQRRVSKLFKENQVQSKNYEKAKLKVAKLYEKVAWQRKDWLHKLSRDLANKYEFVGVEDINLQVMASNFGHGKVVGNQGFGMLRSFIAYKTNLVKVSAASASQTCSSCGYKYDEKDFKNIKWNLSIREWKCPICSSEHDRDINAARNILRKTIEQLSRQGTSRNLMPVEC